MIKIYSKINKKNLVANILRFKEIKKKRINLSPEKEFLQMSAKSLKSNMTVRAHMHKKIIRKTNITQEVWIIFKGKVMAYIFDLNQKIIKKTILKKGDCLILFRGGHGFKNLNKNSMLYEIKSGPYFGKEKDSREISYAI